MTEDGAFALFFRPHPGGFDTSVVPTPGKKMLMTRGQPGDGGGCWAQLELIDALYCWFSVSRQDSGQRNISYTRYPKTCFTQIYRDLCGDAMMVPMPMGTNMADGNQQKHLLQSFATNS